MPLRFESNLMLWVALGVTAVTVLIAVVRRPALPGFSQAMVGIALLMLSLAVGGGTWRRARGGELVVMLDVSPSTRTATYRDRAALDRRLRQLLGDTPRRIVLFAEDVRADRGEAVLGDLAAERTIFAPPAADAVLLFSDARFELPSAGPRTFVVIDPALEEPADAAVSRLELRGRDLVATVRVAGTPRDLTLQGTAATKPVRIEPGALAVARAVTGASASAQFNAGDAWPENDGLWITAAPAQTSEKWWVGAEAPAGWRAMEPAALPASSADYLAPAVIVLNNQPAGAIGARQAMLQQYVRDLGGTLILLGGDRAFAAGDYASSTLEALSPLASYPPRPAMQWIVLVDGSGSMSEATADGTLWQVAVSALRQLLPHMPPADVATLGSFAEGISWWSSGKSVRETMGVAFPPGDLSPRGPTNLQRAIEDVIRSASGELPTQLIVVTDADAQLEGAEKIAAQMKAKHLSLHVLAIGKGSALGALQQIAGATGGQVISAADARSWSARLVELGQAAMRDRVEKTPLRVRFLSPLELAAREVTQWNRSWIKATATALAEAREGTAVVHPAAQWRVGAGQVAAAAFGATSQEAAAMANLFARPPRDPRFGVTWDAGSRLRVRVDAVEGKKALNDQELSLDLHGADGGNASSERIRQTGPGSYELSVPAPRTPTFASVRLGGRLLDQIAVAGRYAPEFDAIGNDHEAMHELARRTGGEVIDVRQTKPIDFHWPRREAPLGSWLMAGAAVFMAVGLGWWRAGREGKRVASSK